MHIIPLSSIIIPPSRQRREFREDKIKELADSIAKIGLLHSPVVRVVPIGNHEDQSYELVVGERRLRAIQLLRQSTRSYTHNQDSFQPELDAVPVTFLDELDEDERYEAELHENLLRENLTWQEQSQAVAELHRRREAKNPEHTRSDTAKELAESLNRSETTARRVVSRSLLIDQFKDDKHVQNARDAKEAYKIASAKLQAEFSTDLQSQISAQPSEHTLIVADCREWLSSTKGEQFDLILSDPPYSMGADSFGSAGSAHSYSDDEAQIIISTTIITEGFRVAKPQAHLYLFCDIDHFHALRAAARAAGWYAWRTPLTWVKSGGMGHNPIPEIGFRRQTEWLLYAVKGDRQARHLMGDALQLLGSGDGRTASPEHAATKPVWLFEALIKRSCLPGDKVLDPCCGSGTIFSAAKASHTRATGIELDPGFAQLARAKL